MSFVTNQMFLNSYTMAGLNSSFAVQRSNQNLSNMLDNPFACSPRASLRAEQAITFGSMSNQTLAKCYEMMEESLRKQQKKNIESSFNTFA